MCNAHEFKYCHYNNMDNIKRIREHYKHIDEQLLMIASIVYKKIYGKENKCVKFNYVIETENGASFGEPVNICVNLIDVKFENKDCTYEDEGDCYWHDNNGCDGNEKILFVLKNVVRLIHRKKYKNRITPKNFEDCFKFDN